MSAKEDKGKVDSSEGSRWRLKDGQGRVRIGKEGEGSLVRRVDKKNVKNER